MLVSYLQARCPHLLFTGGEYTRDPCEPERLRYGQGPFALELVWVAWSGPACFAENSRHRQTVRLLYECQTLWLALTVHAPSQLRPGYALSVDI